jgi:hypothetical protein
VLSSIQQQRTPLAYGALFAILPLALGVAVGPLVGFGPCGPNVPSSARLIVLSVGMIALAAPLIAAWLFWLSFLHRRVITAVVGLPMLFGRFRLSLLVFYCDLCCDELPVC